MKKNKIAQVLLILLPLLTFSLAHADTMGFYVGGGIWQANIEGDVGADETPATIDELGVDDEQNTYYFIAIEHPVPVLPNIKVVYNDLSTQGEAVVSRSIVFDDITVPANAATRTEIDLSHTDYTLYWQLLDNYASFDLGLTGRDFDGFASIEYELGAFGETPAESGSEFEDLNEILPMLYTKLQLDLPFSGWFVGGSANYISVDGNSVADLEAKLGYMTDGIGLDVGFDIGYRQMTLTVDDDENVEADISIDGAYASLIVHF